MLETIKRFFAAPVFEDEEKSNNAYLLNFITIAYIIISVMSVTAALFAVTDNMQQTTREALIRTLPILVILVITQILMRSGRVKTASIFLGVFMWLNQTFSMFITGGVSSPALFVYVVVVMIVGLLIGRQYMIVSAIASFVMAFIVLVVENQGLLPAPLSEQSASTSLFTFFFVIFLSTSLLYLYRTRLDEALQKFRDANLALEQAGAQLDRRVADRTKALATSAEVTRRLATVLDPDQLAIEVVREVRDAFDYYYAQIYLMDEAGENLLLSGGTGDAGATLMARGHSVPKGRGLVGRAAGTNTSVLVPDVSQEAGWLPNELLPETKAETAIPISIGNQVLGVLDVQHSIVGGLSEDDVTLLESLAGQVAISLQNARTYEKSRTQAELESLVNVIGQKIQRTTSIEDTLQTAIRELGTAIGASRVKASLGTAPSDVPTEPILPAEPLVAVS